MYIRQVARLFTPWVIVWLRGVRGVEAEVWGFGRAVWGQRLYVLLWVGLRPPAARAALPIKFTHVCPQHVFVGAVGVRVGSMMAAPSWVSRSKSCFRLWVLSPQMSWLQYQSVSLYCTSGCGLFRSVCACIRELLQYLCLACSLVGPVGWRWVWLVPWEWDRCAK